MTLPLALRNRLAELILNAFDRFEAREGLRALAAFCQVPDGSVGPTAATRLAELGWFAPVGDGRMRLLGAHAAHRAALCRRAGAAQAMLEAEPPGEGRTIEGLLARAARLADHGLHFEVHELLEPVWLRAGGSERVGLQALIQVAVALHHAANANRPGAISLLTEGLAKLHGAGSALPLDVAVWSAGLAHMLAALREGRPCPAIPPWPRPPQARDVPAVKVRLEGAVDRRRHGP